MINIQVRGGTPKGSEFLCRSCEYACIRKFANGSEKIGCMGHGVVSLPIITEVVECSRYSPVALSKPTEFYKTAWILNIKNGQPAGFVHAAKFRADNPQDKDFKYI